MLQRLGKYFHHSLNGRLLTLVLLPILVVTPITIGFVVLWSDSYHRDQLLRRVSTDLVIAHDSFERRQRDHLDQLQRLAVSHALVSAMEAADGERVNDLLAALKGTSGFDFLHLLDLHGRRLFSTAHAVSARASLMLRQAAQVGAPFHGIEIYSALELEREDPLLGASVQIAIRPTPRAAPSERDQETRAMVIRALAPVRDTRGTLVALLDGGVVINRDFDVVDRVRDLVYGPGSLLEDSVGTVTIFLDDVRISTNVPLSIGERALGTRVSQAVRDKVLLHGTNWVDRAFVVNDWYISAYEPIIDTEGERVGMLYTGFSETPYRQAYRQTLWLALGLLAFGTALAGVFALWGARTIARPIASMVSVARALRGGRDIRIGELGAGGELTELARQFDQTLDLLTLRNEEIRAAAEKLEETVDARTQELKANNQRLMDTIAVLESTRQQLVASEKLAALGELTAGVAHEINNPLAIIQGNLEILRRELGDDIAPVAVEVELVLSQVERMQGIVGKLLDYSRSSHDSRQLDPIDVRAVIDDAVTLAEHEAFARGIDVQVSHDGAASVLIEPRELEQVLLNLLLNAIHFSPYGKTIRIVSEVLGQNHVLIKVIDSGPGVAIEHRRQIFDPFFTTKDTGTGLGLSVSFGIVRRYHGDIEVQSSSGGGACFVVRLPLADPRWSQPRADHHAA